MWMLRRALHSLRYQQPLAAAPMWFVSVLYSIVASMGVLLAIWENGDRVADHLKSTLTVRKEFETYDFIIIGGGSAGSVVANRISENPDWKVLLIEAGGEPHPLQAVPVFAFTLLEYPQVDWMHKTVPQKNSCLGLVNQQSGWSQGKSLGGSSNINFLLHFRGNPKDFDNWASLTDDPRWNYEHVLKYFKKSEDFDCGRFGGDETLHGLGGPLHVQKPDFTGFADEYVRAGMDMGYSNVDLNGNYTEGFDTCYYAIKNGRRHATYRSYIQPVRRRPNLVIYKYAHVNKIIFRGETNEAYAVQYDRYGEKRYAYARKEIILSAGTVQSPKILMLSGVGPQNHLEDLKIPVIKNLPGVGQNLQDHVTTFLGPFEMDSNKIVAPSFERDITPRSFYDYSTRGQGILTSSGVHASGIFSSSFAKSSNWPDLQLFLIGASVHRDFGKELSRSFNLKSEQFIEYYKDSVGKNSFHQIVSLARPKSRGQVLLERNDPYVGPIIDPKYFEHEDDMKVMLEGARKAMFLAENTTTFSNLGTHFTSTVLPGCENITIKSDEYLECYIRTYTVTLHHRVGTCAMGKIDSPGAVVDSELRVIGVKGLRVVDASVMPVVPVSNTQAPTIMIGEKAADLIKNAWMEAEDPTTTTSTTTEEPTVIDVIIDSNQNQNTNNASDSDTRIIASSDPVLTDCDYCELDARKEDLNLQFAL